MATKPTIKQGRQAPAKARVIPIRETAIVKINPARLKRDRPAEIDIPLTPPPVSDAVGKAIDLAFNPTREKIREVTIIDRVQGRLFPLLDVVNSMFQYCLEISEYRQDKTRYKALYKKPIPVPPDFMDEFMYRAAQWQKSVSGRNLEKITDIALAETEMRSGEDDDIGGGGRDPWKE